MAAYSFSFLISHFIHSSFRSVQLESNSGEKKTTNQPTNPSARLLFGSITFRCFFQVYGSLCFLCKMLECPRATPKPFSTHIQTVDQHHLHALSLIPSVFLSLSVCLCIFTKIRDHTPSTFDEKSIYIAFVCFGFICSSALMLLQRIFQKYTAQWKSMMVDVDIEVHFICDCCVRVSVCLCKLLFSLYSFAFHLECITVRF